MRTSKQLFLVLALSLALLLGAFAPIAQGIQRFRTIYSEHIINSKSITTQDLSAGSVAIGSDYALSFTTAGKQLACGSETVTGTATIATGLTTATYVVPSLGQDPIDGQVGQVTFTPPTTSTFTVKVWKIGVITPTSTITYTTAVSPALVHWCAVGDK